MSAMLEKLDDLALIRRYLDENDADALGALFERHANLAYRMAFRVMRNASEAEEAVQDAFADMTRALPRYRGGAGFKVWLVKAVVGTCKKKIRSHTRRRRREERYSLDREIMAMNAKEEEERTAELAEATRKVLNTLPDLYRLPIWMHYAENMPFQAVAAALASTENTVKSRARRGLELLRNRMARAGLSVSAASVAGVLPLLPREAAPSSLAEWIRNFTRQAASVPHEPMRPTGRTRGIRLAAAAAATVAATGGALLWLDPLSVRSGSSGAPALQSEKTDFFWHCDFNDLSFTNAFTVILGGVRHVPDGGPDGSGCLETTEEDTVLEFLFPVSSPVVLEFRMAAIPPESHGDYSVFCMWNRYESFARFDGIGKRYTFPLRNEGRGPWRSSRQYATDRVLARWLDDKFGGLFVVEPSPDARLRLKFRGRHRVDDMTLRSAAPDDLPDLAVYLDALEKIPSDRRTGVVPLPDLAPAPPHDKVSVTFRPTRH